MPKTTETKRTTTETTENTKATETKRTNTETKILLLVSDGFTPKESGDLKLLFGHDNVVFDNKSAGEEKSSDDILDLAEDCDIIIVPSSLSTETLIELVDPKNNHKPVIVSIARKGNNLSSKRLTTERLDSGSVWAQVVLSALVRKDE